MEKASDSITDTVYRCQKASIRDSESRATPTAMLDAERLRDPPGEHHVRVVVVPRGRRHEEDAGFVQQRGEQTAVAASGERQPYRLAPPPGHRPSTASATRAPPTHWTRTTTPYPPPPTATPPPSLSADTGNARPIASRAASNTTPRTGTPARFAATTR
ncbi:hypothetical protein [Sinosporangium album]|uniref:hypothetical protein n=1 Tax=Sinosporangium album TaxID=504805 RepID=UPI0015A300CF|nr:hypothetical protein [Sinosporangium album]